MDVAIKAKDQGGECLTWRPCAIQDSTSAPGICRRWAGRPDNSSAARSRRVWASKSNKGSAVEIPPAGALELRVVVRRRDLFCKVLIADVEFNVRAILS